MEVKIPYLVFTFAMKRDKEMIHYHHHHHHHNYYYIVVSAAVYAPRYPLPKPVDGTLV